MGRLWPLSEFLVSGVVTWFSDLSGARLLPLRPFLPLPLELLRPLAGGLEPGMMFSIDKSDTEFIEANTG